MHLVDSEPPGYVECRKIVAEPGDRIRFFDQDKWAAALRYDEMDLEEALELFGALRRANHRLLSALPAEAWERSVELEGSGRMDLDRWLRVYTNHVPTHLRQMAAVVEAWRAGGG